MSLSEYQKKNRIVTVDIEFEPAVFIITTDEAIEIIKKQAKENNITIPDDIAEKMSEKCVESWNKIVDDSRIDGKKIIKKSIIRIICDVCNEEHAGGVECSKCGNMGGHVIFKSDDCTNCKNFSTNTISYPSGRCTKYGFLTGVGFYCDEFIYFMSD